MRRLLSVCSSLLLAAGVSAQSGAPPAPDPWSFRVSPYLWGAGLQGRVGVGQALSAPIDLSFGDTLEALDFAFMGVVEARKDRFGFSADLAHLNLGAGITGPVDGRLGLGADVRTSTLEGVVTYRAFASRSGSFVEMLAGARYMKN